MWSVVVNKRAGMNEAKYRDTLQAPCRSYNRIRRKRTNDDTDRSDTAKLASSKELGLSFRERT